MSLYAKPYSEACEQNKAPILAVLREVFTEPGLILEIGAGTGQHAVHFARELPHLDWQPTDQADYLPGIRLWIDEAGLPNLRQPLALDTRRTPWPVTQAAGAFSANTTHIMHWPAVEGLFRGIGQVLQPGGAFCLYGPFNDNGRHTSASNAASTTLSASMCSPPSRSLSSSFGYSGAAPPNRNSICGATSESVPTRSRSSGAT